MGAGGAPGSWNRYAYAANNPLKFVDPLGLAPAATFSEEITVVGQAESSTLRLPKWLFNNFLLDVEPHFDGGRDFSAPSGTSSAWKAWEGTGDCSSDPWCQIFAEVGSNATAMAYLEFGVSAIAGGYITGSMLFPGAVAGYNPIRVRHFTSPQALGQIRRSGHLRPGRGTPIGVHVEGAPFQGVRRGGWNPSSQAQQHYRLIGNDTREKLNNADSDRHQIRINGG